LFIVAPESPIYRFPSQQQNSQVTSTTRTMGHSEPSKKRRSLSQPSSHLTAIGGEEEGPNTEGYTGPDSPMFWPFNPDTETTASLSPSLPVHAVTFHTNTDKASQEVQFVYYHNHNNHNTQPRARSKDHSAEEAAVAGSGGPADLPLTEGSASPRALDIMYILN